MNMNYESDSLDQLVYETYNAIPSLKESHNTEEKKAEIVRSTAAQTGYYALMSFVREIAERNDLFADYNMGTVTVYDVNGKLTFEGKFREFLLRFN